MFDDEIIKNRQLKNKLIKLIIEKRKELLRYKDVINSEYNKIESEIIEKARLSNYNIKICDIHNFPYSSYVCPVCRSLKNV